MKKVLVAEDEESIREFIVINLTRSGYNVEQAENGAVALEKFSQDENGFDVAILDIMMPELDGLSVCKELRKRSSDLGIINRFHRVNLWQGLTLYTEELK